MVAKLEGRSVVTSSFKDAFKSVHRYISNTFTDIEKQQAINLFLGKFQQSCAIGPTGPGSEVDETGFPFHLWDLETDFHLHNLCEDWPTPSKDNSLYAGTQSYYKMEKDYQNKSKSKESVQSGRWIQAALDEYNRRVADVEGHWSSSAAPGPAPPLLGVAEKELGRETPSRFGVLPKEVVEQQYRPVMTAFTHYDDSTASIHEAILLPPRSASLVETDIATSDWSTLVETTPEWTVPKTCKTDKCASCPTAWSHHENVELGRLARTNGSADGTDPQMTNRHDDIEGHKSARDSDCVQVPHEVQRILDFELPNIKNYLAKTAHGDILVMNGRQVTIDCVKIDSFLRTSNCAKVPASVSNSGRDPSTQSASKQNDVKTTELAKNPSSISVKFADQAEQVPRTDELEERAQREDERLQDQFRQDSAQAWVDHSCDDAQKAIFEQFSQCSGGIDSRWGQKNLLHMWQYGMRDFEVRRNECVAIQMLLKHAESDHTGELSRKNDHNLLELYLDDAVGGIQHLLDPDRRSALNLECLGQHDTWEALERKYSQNSPIEHREMASRAGPNASEPRTHLLAWVAYRACFPDVRAVLRRFKMDGKRDLTAFAHALAVLRIETVKQMEELTAPVLERADPSMSAVDREAFLAIVRSAEFADFVCGVRRRSFCYAFWLMPDAATLAAGSGADLRPRAGQRRARTRRADRGSGISAVSCRVRERGQHRCALLRRPARLPRAAVALLSARGECELKCLSLEAAHSQKNSAYLTFVPV